MRRWLLATLLALGALLGSCQRFAGERPNSGIVSLAPAITDTLFAIGAGADVVAISDYCDSPAEALGRPRVGTSITPNYEAIARLAPALILGEANVSARKRELEALAKTSLLPWLALDEVTASIRELGRITGRTERATALAARMHARLSLPEPQSGPRVLLVLGEGDAQEIWFVRRNSLHGAALRAAGARNAVAEDIEGPPRLAHERLLGLDPDAIIVLSRPDRKPGSEAAGFSRFPTLRAVKERRVALLSTAHAFANGPQILTLVDELRKKLGELGLVQ